jgi:hypothetical protein
MVDEIQKALDRLEASADTTIDKLKKKLALIDLKICDGYTKNGIFTPFIYINPQTMIPVECSKGHKSFKTYNSVLKNAGCRKCHLANIKDKGLAGLKKYHDGMNNEKEELRRILWEEKKKEMEQRNRF